MTDAHQPLALVTGAGAGLGAAIAIEAAENGYRVALMDSNAKCLQDVAGRLQGAVALACDVTDEEAVDAAISSLPHAPDLLVNNAGIVRLAPILDARVEDFRKVIEVNLVGAFIVCRAVGRRMSERRSGCIVNIASIGGVAPSPGTNAYAPTKAGILSLTQLLAIELGPFGVRVNAVSPGLIDGGMSADFYVDERIRERRADAIPLRRLGTPSDVAEAVMFLASNQARYVHGHNLVVDGGLLPSVLAQLPRSG